jgi:hypothetical protein
MMSGDQITGAITKRKARLEFILRRKGHSRKEARNLAERFLLRLPTHRLQLFRRGGITKAASLDVLDAKYRNTSTKR